MTTENTEQQQAPAAGIDIESTVADIASSLLPQDEEGAGGNDPAPVEVKEPEKDGAASLIFLPPCAENHTTIP